MQLKMMAVHALASPLNWKKVPITRLRLGMMVTALSTAMVAVLIVYQLRNIPPQRRAVRIFLAIAATILLLFSATDGWLLLTRSAR